MIGENAFLMLREESHVGQDNCCQEFLGKKRQNLFQFLTKKEQKSLMSKRWVYLLALLGGRRAI